MFQNRLSDSLPQFLSNSIDDLIVAVCLVALLRITLGILRRSLRRGKLLPKWLASESARELTADLALHFKKVTIWAIALWPALLILNVPPGLLTFSRKALVLIGTLQLAIWGHHTISFWLSHSRQLKVAGLGKGSTAAGLLSIITRLALFTVLVLFALDNLGVNITSLIAGLGVGGIAVALALQNILGDLFASLTIVLDRPFVVGDAVAVGEFRGTIEHIGLKTTRMRSIDGEQLVFANSDLLQSRLRNFGRLLERRVSLRIGVTYQTTPEMLRQIPVIIKTAVEAIDPPHREKVRFDCSHLVAFAASSVDFDTVYWILGPETRLFMDVQEQVNLAVFKTFNDHKIDFAYPTQTVFEGKGNSLNT